MSDQKLSALTAETTVAKTDIAYFVDDPGGTPLSRKATIANLSKGIELTNVPQASGAITFQPAAGSSLNVSLATTGDFIVNTNQFVVDTSSGNLGIGTSDIEAWSATYKAIQIGAQPAMMFGANLFFIMANAYYDGAWKYRANNFASVIYFTDGGHLRFQTAPTGTADAALTWTTRLHVGNLGQIGVGTETPNANAIMDLTSTTMAFMPPRMTTTQRDNVASPTAGMVVYNSTTGKLNVRGAAGWEAVTSA